MSGCLIFQGNRLGVNPISTCDPREFGVFGGAEHHTHFCGGRIESCATQWVAFFGSRGKIQPATQLCGGGIPSATHRRSKRAIRAATHPARPENWSRDPPRRREDEGGGSRLQSAGSRVEDPYDFVHFFFIVIPNIFLIFITKPFPRG